jgi:hypothetical protein
VFLSYASQDAAAAQRICDALRFAGVEVWFDRSGLQGGDAWDRKIRQQIRDCALFVPVVSAATEARREGYFRLEWHLADQRSHLMGKSRAFILPVCIDGTPEAQADVPDSFAAVHWTRLPEGEAGGVFCAHITHLLAREHATPSASGAAAPIVPAVPPPARAAHRPWRFALLFLLIAATALTPRR